MRQLIVRTPADLVSVAPSLLGFVPRDSVVMMTFNGRETFHARMDLPSYTNPLAPSINEVVDSLVPPCERYGVPDVALVLFDDDGTMRGDVPRKLNGAFLAAGISVIAIVLTRDGQAHTWRGEDEDGTDLWLGPEPVTVHHGVVEEAVEHGNAPMASREAMAQTLRHRPEEIVHGFAGPRREALAFLAADTMPTDEDIVTLSRWLNDTDVRDAAWAPFNDRNTTHTVQRWTTIATRMPHHAAGSAYAVLALACWLNGDGAMARVAYDNAIEFDSTNTLARLVGALLTNAVAPSQFAEMMPHA